MTDKRELLADYAHASWAGWMRYLFDVSGDFNEDGSFTISPEYVQRWTRQMNTPYTQLSEGEKGSDRKEAYKILALLHGATNKERPNRYAEDQEWDTQYWPYGKEA